MHHIPHGADDKAYKEILKGRNPRTSDNLASQAFEQGLRPDLHTLMTDDVGSDVGGDGAYLEDVAGGGLDGGPEGDDADLEEAFDLEVALEQFLAEEELEQEPPREDGDEACPMLPTLPEPPSEAGLVPVPPLPPPPEHVDNEGLRAQGLGCG